jgi:THO complex subunit 1
VVPPELLPADVRAKLHARTTEKNKRTKKEETKGPTAQLEDPQVRKHNLLFCVSILVQHK